MYEDDTVHADGTGVTIPRYGVTGSTRRFGYDEIRSACEFEMGIGGKWRLVGAGFSRNWYGWDSSRRTRSRAIAFDTGGFFLPTVTPDDPDALIAAIADHVDVT